MILIGCSTDRSTLEAENEALKIEVTRLQSLVELGNERSQDAEALALLAQRTAEEAALEALHAQEAALAQVNAMEDDLMRSRALAEAAQYEANRKAEMARNLEQELLERAKNVTELQQELESCRGH